MIETPQMRVVPAGHGWLWLRGAFPILGRHVALWLLLVFAYFTAVSIVARIPLLGAAAFLLTTPALTLSFMHMAREVDRAHPLHPRMLAAGFRANPQALLGLGGAYLVGVLVAMSVTNALHGDFVANFVGRKDPSPDALLAGIATFALLYAPVMLALWFAPALSGWHRMPAVKALFFSFYAAQRNWRALLVYGVALFALWAIAFGGLMIVLRLIVPSITAGPAADGFRGGLAMMSFAATPIVLAGFALQFISSYLSYRDVFSAPAEPVAPAG